MKIKSLNAAHENILKQKVICLQAKQKVCPLVLVYSVSRWHILNVNGFQLNPETTLMFVRLLWFCLGQYHAKPLIQQDKI